MQEYKRCAASARFEDDDDIWWVTGGQDDMTFELDMTEFYTVQEDDFYEGVDLPESRMEHTVS